MKSQRIFFWAVICLILTPFSLLAKCNEYDDKYYYTLDLNSKSSTCYSYYLPAGEMAVFTLKYITGNADFDLYIYDYSDFSEQLAKGISSGINSELTTLWPQNNANRIYLEIKNISGVTGTYRLYVHRIDLADKAVQVLTEYAVQNTLEYMIGALFGVDDNSSQEAQDNVKRGAALSMSFLKGRSLSETSIDMMIKEMTMKVQKELGYGFAGKLTVKYGTSLLKDIYRYY